MNDHNLMTTSIEISNLVKHIDYTYDELKKYNVIKRLVLLVDKWDKLFTESTATKEGGI